MTRLVSCIFLMCFLVFSTGTFAGSMQWEKTFGGRNNDGAFSVQPVGDGYLVIGYTDCFEYGGRDVWVIKLDKSGNQIWNRVFSGPEWDKVASIKRIKDGYIAVGRSGPPFKGDAWVVKMDKNANRVWKKLFGGNNDDGAYSAQPTKDGFLIAGYTNSYGKGGYDAWIIKLNKDGNRVWSKVFGGKSNERAFSVQQTRNKGYIVVGRKGLLFKGDAWVVKMDRERNIVWERTFGGSGDDVATAVCEMPSGEFIVVGWTYSFGHGKSDMWIMKLDREGNTIWSDTFGGRGNDWANSVEKTDDGGYIVGGVTYSSGKGNSDAWVKKF